MSDPSSFLPTTAALMPLPEASDALPVGALVGEFVIMEVIGVGGFGIVYRAWEPALEREVALKEYMPMGMVGREAGGRVTLRSRGYEEDYTLGLRSFVNEARLLARFDHPSLVKVHRFWEANGTAYMAMPFYKAQTLRQRRQELDAQAPTQAWLMSMIEPLLGALAEMHRADVYHRDIAPDNILWCADNRPVLLDFGAARHVLADRTQHLTAVLKPQFAPIEQYADAQAMRQGPWTDIFALASTCYFMLTGRPPLPATARILSDDLAPLAELAPAGFSAHVLATLDWAMAVRPQDRPQSVAMLWDALNGHAKVPERIVEPRPAPERVDTTRDYTRTIQTGDRAMDDSPGGRASAFGRASAAVPTASSSVGLLRAASARIPRHHRLLLAFALVTAGAAAWVANGRDAGAPAEVLAAAAASSAAMPAASTSVILAASPLTEAASAVAPAPARARAASSALASRAAGPREACSAARSANLDECVRHACKTEPRFRRADACVRLQRQAQPWWKLFKPG